MSRKKQKPIVILNQEAVVYAFRNDFKVFPVVKSDGSLRIIIEKGVRSLETHEVYSQKTIHQAIANTYNKIYKQYGEQSAKK